MSDYVPDKWVILKVKGKEETLYKVFACWYGGYGGSDSWQMNSGIKAISESKDYWLFEGFSGSVYKCFKQNYGMHTYGSGILNDIINKSEEVEVDVIVMLENTNWLDLSYE